MNNIKTISNAEKTVKENINTSCVSLGENPSEVINVFFAADAKYLPCLAVAISSLSANASDDYFYHVRILTKDLTPKDVAGIRRRVKTNIKISVTDISDKIFHVREELALRLRDYYSDAIYYRLFISEIFADLKRAVYLDSDIVLCKDVAELYFSDIGDCIIGAVSDESVLSEPIFRDYTVKHIGMSRAEEYFNSGVLVMNLKKIREEKIKEKFLHLLCKYNFKTVAPDQDYLNYLCQGKVKYLDRGWNKHAIRENIIPKEELYLMHYNMFNKPWHYENVQNEELFWEYARNTDFEELLLNERKSYSEDSRNKDLLAAKNLLSAAKQIASSPEEAFVRKDSYSNRPKRVFFQKSKKAKSLKKQKNPTAAKELIKSR